MTGRKVAVVGMGGIFPTCSDLEDFAQKLLSGQSLIRRWDEAEAFGKQIRSKVSGFVSYAEAGLEPHRSSDASGYPETFIDLRDRIPSENLATSDIGSIWAMLGSLDAISMAGWKEEVVQSARTGVVIGSGGGGHEVLRRAWDKFFHLGKKSRATGPHNVDRSMVYRDAANVSCLIRSKGVCESIGSACACGLGNIGYAYRLIKFGVQDRVIAGGTEGTSLESFLGFDGMSVLSRNPDPAESSRPFDRKRDGFVCSFGCGIVALEELESAKARGAQILAVIDGYFNNSDGDGDMFAPSFEGQSRLWQGLQAEVGGKLSPDVVKVHGTSTPTGDTIEMLSVVHAMGREGYLVSAPKSQFGHMLGAAGAVEFIAALLMLRAQKVSPCRNAHDLKTEPEPYQLAPGWEGPQAPLSEFRSLIPTEPTARQLNQIVCLNYGFGGTNSSISISLPNFQSS